MGRWKEGLTVDGVAPMPWLKSSANWFPKTEEVQTNEIRVTFMGSSHDCGEPDARHGLGPRWSHTRLPEHCYIYSDYANLRSDSVEDMLSGITRPPRTRPL